MQDSQTVKNIQESFSFSTSLEDNGADVLFVSDDEQEVYVKISSDGIHVKNIFDIQNNTYKKEGTKPTDYNGNEISIFNKIVCIGDSLTAGTFNHNESGTQEYINYEKYSFPTYLKKLTGCDVSNYGLGGYTSFEWYNTKSGVDLSGYDMCIIQMGVNDSIRNNKNYGTYWSEDTENGFKNIISKLKNEKQ